jgi:hypothetical protein
MAEQFVLALAFVPVEAPAPFPAAPARNRWHRRMSGFKMALLMALSLPIHSQATGKRILRTDMYELGDWDPEKDEIAHGPRTEFAEGIYVVTVHEGTPTDWLKIAMKASIASGEERPGPDLLPAFTYDSFIAVASKRIVGGALVALESAARYRWNNHLKPDGEAHSLEELFRKSPEKCVIRIDRNLGWPPAIYTIWVHSAWRKRGIGGQIVQAIAAYYGLPLAKLCFRLPLSKEAVGMTRALGLIEIIGCS